MASLFVRSLSASERTDGDRQLSLGLDCCKKRDTARHATVWVDLLKVELLSSAGKGSGPDRKQVEGRAAVAHIRQTSSSDLEHAQCFQ